MLRWDSPKDFEHAEGMVRKYAGCHEDALGSRGLRGKTADREGRETEGKEVAGTRTRTREEVEGEWKGRYGEEAARRIGEAVEGCWGDYVYLWGLRMGAEDWGVVEGEEGEKRER